MGWLNVEKDDGESAESWGECRRSVENLGEYAERVRSIQSALGVITI